MTRMRCSSWVPAIITVLCIGQNDSSTACSIMLLFVGSLVDDIIHDISSFLIALHLISCNI